MAKAPCGECQDRALAARLLSILVADLGYKEKPTQKRLPKRHTEGWAEAEAVLGADVVREIVQVCLKQLRDERSPYEPG